MEKWTEAMTVTINHYLARVLPALRDRLLRRPRPPQLPDGPDVDRAHAERRQPEPDRLLAAAPDLTGQVFSVFVITIAAGEAAIGLAIMISLFRQRKTLNVEEARTR